MIENKEKTVAEYVKENIKTAHIFKKYGIDFCCGGGISIHKACVKNNVNYDNLMNDLNNTENSPNDNNFDDYSLTLLTTYIEEKHHSYVNESINILTQYMSKVANVHGNTFPVLYDIQILLNNVISELITHLKKEELILFPYITKMEKSVKNSINFEIPSFETVQNPINMMHSEHDEAGDIMKEINRLTDNYTTPEWACNTFRALYDKLKEFEDDLHIHIHLENNILFPKTIEMEKNMNYIKDIKNN